MAGTKSEMPRPRRSACAAAALHAEIVRLAQMSIEQRVKAALSMRERFGLIAVSTKAK